jgi:hypothetical protein
LPDSAAPFENQFADRSPWIFRRILSHLKTTSRSIRPLEIRYVIFLSGTFATDRQLHFFPHRIVGEKFTQPFGIT